MIKVLVVEDNERELIHYKKTIGQIAELEPYYFTDGESALQTAENIRIDMFVIDIHLPKMDGFTLANKLRQKPEYTLTPILFITGGSRSPLAAFKVFHCYDYILKPFTAEKLKSELETLVQGIVSNTTGIEKPSDSNDENVELICISTRDGDFFLQKKSILFLEAHRKECEIHMKGRVPIERCEGITKIMNEINDDYLVRCHKSFAINIRYIYKIEQINYRRWEAILRDSDKRVDIGEKYYTVVYEKLQRLLAESQGEKD